MRRARSLLSRRRAAALGARERQPWEAHQAALLRATLSVARARLARYADMPPLPAGTEARDWLRAHYPVISKSDLLRQRGAFYPNGGVRRPWWPSGKTSGTSGTPLEVFRSLDSVVWEEAFHLQAWRWAGFMAGQPQAVLRGDPVLGLDRSEPPFWHWDGLGRQLFLSTRHLSMKHAEAMLDALARIRPAMLRAYPSACAELARLAEGAGHALRLPAVVTGSEPLYPMQRERIERAFACKVFDFYGMAERVAYAAQCEHGHYHLHPEYSFVEILDAQGRATNEFGDVVGTTLHNHVMPLVRYRIADRACWVGGACPCGCSYPRVELASGKLEDQLYDRDGTAVSASIITFAFKGLAHIRKSQVAQLGPGRWEVRVVPEAGYSTPDGLRLLRNLDTDVSNKLDVTLRLVEDIASEPSGKFKWVVQEWPGAKPD